jgi:hypothetical protein
MVAGAFQVIVGTAVVPAAVIVTCVDALRFSGETVVEDGDEPAGADST